jgi:DNA-directed RNA polymerase subunit RPC12/RpoP
MLHAQHTADAAAAAPATAATAASAAAPLIEIDLGELDVETLETLQATVTSRFQRTRESSVHRQGRPGKRQRTGANDEEGRPAAGEGEGEDEGEDEDESYPITVIIYNSRRHEGTVKPFVCSYPGCASMFADRTNLAAHIRRHTHERPYVCIRCDKRFAHKATLRDHVNQHTGIQPYGCERCGRRFNQRSNLTRHTKIHTGAQPWKCMTCGRSFNQSSNFKQHMANRHAQLLLQPQLQQQHQQQQHSLASPSHLVAQDPSSGVDIPTFSSFLLDSSSQHQQQSL